MDQSQLGLNGTITTPLIPVVCPFNGVGAYVPIIRNVAYASIPCYSFLEALGVESVTISPAPSMATEADPGCWFCIFRWLGLLKLRLNLM
jgi:hypothetical protein